MELSISEQVGRECRHHPRVSASFPIRLRHGERTWSGRAKNVSLSGLAFEGLDPVGLGRVHLELSLPSEHAPLRLQGEVVREDRDLAVRFLDLDWPEILALARYVSTRL